MTDFSEYVDFGAYAKARRKELGLTQDEVARLIGKSRSYIAQIETGTMPTEDAIVKLVLALKMPIDEFLDAGVEADVVSGPENELAKMFTPLYKKLSEYLEPAQYVEIMTMFSDGNSMLQRFFELNNQAPTYDIAPEGWSELSPGDKSLMKKVIKSLAEKKIRRDE